MPGNSSRMMKAGIPSIDRCCGLTRWIGLANPLSRRFCRILYPTEVLRGLAPTSAIEPGANSLSRRKVLISALVPSGDISELIDLGEDSPGDVGWGSGLDATLEWPC